MANAWRRERGSNFPSRCTLLLLSLFFLFFFLYLILPYIQTPLPQTQFHSSLSDFSSAAIQPFDCFKCPSSPPIFANRVEGLKYPFIYSLADLGIPEKPQKNILRMLKGKPFRRPDISQTVQEVLEGIGRRNGVVVDVGANVGMATFAATAMGFRVLAFEPVLENLQRICDGVFLNRVGDKVTVFEAVASDRLGNVTFHKLVGRLDNSAISASGAKLAFKSNKEVAVSIRSVPLDSVIPDSLPVVLLKIDVQGWEYHVLRGAAKLLSRKASEAPFLIYEEDENLLSASNSSAKEIREFLASVGYHRCTQHGNDAHCKKD